jgi:hypothetical protein
MGQLQWKRHRDVEAEFQLKNRSEAETPLLRYLRLEEVRDHLEYV